MCDEHISEADNFIKAVKTGRFDVDIHPDFGAVMEHEVSLSIWCRTFMCAREKNVSFLKGSRISFA